MSLFQKLRQLQQPFKYLIYSLLIILLAVVGLVGSHTVSRAQPSRLQTEPTAVIDAVIQDLSQKLGKTFTRGTVDNWTWEEDIFPDAGLGCPQPGQTYPAGSVHGYKVLITINGILYDYRANKTTSVFFLCSPAASSIQPIQSQPTPRPVTVAPSATAIPVVSTVAPINTSGANNPTVIPAGTSSVELAYIALDGNVHVRNIASGADTALTADGSVHLTIQNALLDPLFSTARSYGGLRWSPDGSKLLFVEFSTRTIYVALSGQAPIQIVSDYGLDHGFEMLPVWSPDGTQIAYAAMAPNTTTKAQLLTVAPGSGQPPNLVTEFKVNVVNKNPIVMNATVAVFFSMAAFERENHLSPPVLAWVGNTIIYGPDDGTIKLVAVDSQSGAVKWTGNILDKMTISPDGKHAVGRIPAGDGPLGFMDLSTGQVTTSDLVKGLDRVAWTPDSQSILYTAYAPGINVVPDPNSVLGKQLFQQYWQMSAGSSNIVQLWRIPISGGTPVQLFAHEGSQAGLISTAPDGSGIVLSLITSMKSLIQALNTARTLADADQALPHAELFYVQNNGTAVSAGIRLALGGQPALGVGSFVPVTSQVSIGASTVTAVPLVQAGPTSTLSVKIVSNVNGQCPGAPPSRLAIGGIGRVTPGDPNLLRDQAGGSKTLGIIPAGATFSVVQGPVCVSNGVAWWQVTYNGVTGWTAEGQGSNYYLSP